MEQPADGLLKLGSRWCDERSATTGGDGRARPRARAGAPRTTVERVGGVDIRLRQVLLRVGRNAEPIASSRVRDHDVRQRMDPSKLAVDMSARAPEVNKKKKGTYTAKKQSEMLQTGVRRYQTWQNGGNVARGGGGRWHRRQAVSKATKARAVSRRVLCTGAGYLGSSSPRKTPYMC